MKQWGTDMKQTIEIGFAPIDEDCAQVGDEAYEARASLECKTYTLQLLRHCHAELGTIPSDVGVRLWTRSNPHDFGTYYEVVVTFDGADKKAVDMAFWLEANQPLKWDDESRTELGL